MKKIILQELQTAAYLLNHCIQDEKQLQCITQAADIMIDAIQRGKKIIACGNGGSHCDAMHFAEEMTGKFRHTRKALPAMAISEASHLTCVGNDYGFLHVFARFIEGLGCAGDVLLAISTSGKSANVVLAAQKSQEKKMAVIALTGPSQDNFLAQHATCAIHVPYTGPADRIQEMHIKIIHILILLIEKGLAL